MRQGVMLLGLVAFVASGPAAGAKFSGGSHFMPGPHMIQPLEAHPRHPHGFGYGGATALDTLQSGTFDIGSDSAPDVGPIPPTYLPPPYYPAYYAPPPPCIRPLLIILTNAHTPKKLPRVVYGTNPRDCQN